jgi:hypothetical protein
MCQLEKQYHKILAKMSENKFYDIQEDYDIPTEILNHLLEHNQSEICCIDNPEGYLLEFVTSEQDKYLPSNWNGILNRKRHEIYALVLKYGSFVDNGKSPSKRRL